jgi:DNA-binding Lrp family transcriptional regulator
MNQPLDFRLLNEFQRDFPLCPAPFTALAVCLGVGESRVIEQLTQLQAAGKVSRVGAVFAPGRLGASTLAAMAIPPDLLDTVAAAVNGFPEVNHNYEREHRYNLWFVVTAASQEVLQARLRAIEVAAGFPLLILPLLEEFHIDLGFPLRGEHAQRVARRAGPAVAKPLDAHERRLLAALQEGLALTARPFAHLAAQIECTETAVLGRIAAWLAEGVIKRFGVVVRHHELGFTANAMLVHDIPDEQVSQLGHALAGESAVTLSYRRPRCLPAWGYNLFCMIHGRERGEVEATIQQLRARHGLENYAHEVLFSLTRFKQNGARYV